MSSENKPSFVPFDLPEDDDDDEVFSSVLPKEGQRTATSGAFPAVSAAAAKPIVPVSALAKLRITNGGSQRTFEVQSSPFQIGRHVGDARIEDPYLSPVHVQLRIVRSALMLEDLNSKNGVFLRIADELALEDFDEIAIGHQRYIYRTSWDPRPGSNEPYQDVTVASGGDAPNDAHRLICVLNNGNISRVYPVVGRHVIGAQGDIVVESDPAASQIHAMIERRHGKCFIKDLDSETGTFIRIHDPVELIEGDCFLVGRTRVAVSY